MRWERLDRRVLILLVPGGIMAYAHNLRVAITGTRERRLIVCPRRERPVHQ